MNKKSIIFIIFVLILLVITTSLVYADQFSSDSVNASEWRMDGRTLNGTCFYPGDIPGDISQLEVRSYSTSDFTGDTSIVNGFVYGISLRDSIYRLNASNISQRIDKTADYTLFQYPVQSIWNDFIYAANEYGNVYQFNASNLSQLIASNSQPYPQHYSSLIVYAGTVYFTDWWSTGGPIYQANASNVTQVLNRYASSGCDSAPSISDDFIYYACRSTILQLNASNISRKTAQYSAGGSVDTGSGIAIGDGSIYFGTSDDKLYQLNASNVSNLINTFTTGGDIDSRPAYANGFVYVGSNDGYTYQLNASNISQQIANYSTGAVYSGLTATPNYVLVSGSKLYQLNASNISQQIANYSLASATVPSIANGIIYVAAGGNFYQFGTDAPTAVLNSPLNAYVLNQDSEEINFTCSAFDFIGLTNISLYITNASNGSFSLNQTATISGQTNSSTWTLNLTRGNYTWKCLASDTDSKADWSVNRILAPDTTSPALNITYPSNNFNTSITNLNVNYTVYDAGVGLDSCWYSNDSMTFNTTLASCANITTVSWSEGQHNVTIYANDTAGNRNSSSVRFTIDTIFPTITITTPVNNSNSSSNRLNVNYSAYDINRASCWYSNDSMTANTTLASCANITTVTWTQGYHNVTIWTRDSAGNTNSSSVTFYIDSTAPALNITYPANNFNTSSTNLNVNYTVSDLNGISACWYSNDSMTFNTTLASCANITTVSWSEGQHNVTIYANDTFNNINSSTIRFSIDNIAPTFNNLANQTVTYGNAFSYQINATDTSGISCFTVNDTNFNINCSGYLRNNTLVSTGFYWLNITTNDSANNVNSALISVNVTLRPNIALTLISPTGNINASQYQMFQVSVNVSCSNTDCGEINVSLDPTTTIYNFTSCGASGRSGPNQTQCNTNYTGTPLAGLVGVVSGIQNFTVPYAGSYSIEVAGAAGGCANGGRGAKMYGEFSLSSGTILYVLVGQKGGCVGYGGGGGGSFVANGSSYAAASPLIVAGGGGGDSSSSSTGLNGTDAINGTDGRGTTGTKGVNGTGGTAGTGSYKGCGGGGFYGNATGTSSYCSSGAGFIFGGSGGTSSTNGAGGFGGGGGNGWYGGGGAGGYSGGGGGYSDGYAGGGGGSYNLGTNQSNTNGSNSADGYVKITYIGLTKGGLISTNTSATPFYTTTRNPYNLTLNNGQSQIISFDVNATGAIGNNYTFFVYVNKTSDLSIGSSTPSWNVSITAYTGLGYPAINIVYPVNNSNYTSNISALNFSISGQNITDCWYSTSNGIINSSIFAAGQNFTDIISTEGWNIWTAYCNNTNSSIGNASVTFYKDSALPVITLNSPADSYSNSTQVSLNITFNCSASDNLALRNISLYITNASNRSFSLNQTTNITGTASNANWTLSLGVGNYTWNCYASDSLGNLNYSLNRSLAINYSDITPPGLNITYPVNSTVYQTVNSLNYTVSDNIGASSCWWSNNSGVWNSTAQDAGVNWTGLSTIPAWNTWTLYCNDTSNNVNSSTVRFYLDSVAPELSFVNPTPQNASASADSYVLINLSIGESSLSSLIYNWNNTNYTMYDSSLVFMMNMDNLSAIGENSTYAVDSSLYRNNGTVISATWNSSGKYNGAYMFDGVNSLIQVANNLAVNVTGNLTVAAWIKASSWQADSWRGTIIGKDEWSGAGSLSKGYVLRAGNNGALSFTVSTLGSVSWREALTPSLMSANTWYYVTGTFNGTTTLAYINGVRQGSNSASHSLMGASNYPLEIGKDPYGSETNYRRFNGSIDEVRIWNRSLSAAEVYEQYASNLQRYNSTQWYFYVNQSKNSTAGLDYGNYTYQLFAADNFGNLNQTEQRIFTIRQNTAPTATQNSPANNSVLNRINYLLLNTTVFDSDLDNLTAWIYGGYANGTYSLINISYNLTNGTSLSYNWSLGSSGRYNWTVVVSDGRTNSTNSYFYFNLSNFTISCEAGGPYQKDALVLVRGTVLNESVAVSNYPVNISIYDASMNLDANKSLTTASNGIFETNFSGLAVGNYILNASSFYNTYNETCQDTFSVGSRASLILDKIVSISNISNYSATYNVILRITNNGGSDAASAVLVDDDSADSPYILDDISANSSTLINYLKTYTRESLTYNTSLAIARLNATDLFSGREISANSSEIILSIPAYDLSQLLTLTKNVYYNSENSSSVNYTVSIEIVNSGGKDLENIMLIDSDLGLAETISLNRTQNYSFNISIVVDKAASNTNKLFAKASASINGENYFSNQIHIRIPGYGGPADAIVDAPESVEAGSSFDTVITVENQNQDIGQDFIIDYCITN